MKRSTNISGSGTAASIHNPHSIAALRLSMMNNHTATASAANHAGLPSLGGGSSKVANHAGLPCLGGGSSKVTNMNIKKSLLISQSLSSGGLNKMRRNAQSDLSFNRSNCAAMGSGSSNGNASWGVQGGGGSGGGNASWNNLGGGGSTTGSHHRRSHPSGAAKAGRSLLMGCLSDSRACSSKSGGGGGGLGGSRSSHRLSSSTNLRESTSNLRAIDESGPSKLSSSSRTKSKNKIMGMATAAAAATGATTTMDSSNKSNFNSFNMKPLSRSGSHQSEPLLNKMTRSSSLSNLGGGSGSSSRGSRNCLKIKKIFHRNSSGSGGEKSSSSTKVSSSSSFARRTSSSSLSTKEIEDLQQQQQQKEQQKGEEKEKFTFEIYDGSAKSANGAFSDFIYGADSDDEENDQLESKKWESIQDHV